MKLRNVNPETVSIGYCSALVKHFLCKHYISHHNMPLCRRDSSWFDAILKNNVQFVEQNKQAYQRLYENRLNGPNIHAGWAGIHYAAALNLKEIFISLFDGEYDLLTDKASLVHSIYLGRQANIEAGSSIIHILIAVNATELLEYVFNKWYTNPEYADLAGVKNDAGQTALIMAPVVKTAAAMMWATNERAIRNEIRLSTNVD